MSEIHKFVEVEFNRFKAFRKFRLTLKHFNVLVGPNNSGKSTILAAFRILAAAMRRANTRKTQPLNGPDGIALGHNVELSAISVAEENIFYNYDDSEPAEVVFRLSNQNSLKLYFPERGVCFLIPDTQGASVTSPSMFKRRFNCPIGFVPILGPVEHHELLYEREAARLALFNYRAARNFRNIWYHYPEKFQEFKETLKYTWPGMDIDRPEVDMSHERARLIMFCPEKRIPREIFWSGFGFQVWCQMLTHLIQSKDVSLFLIDEPDIYLHSDLQRQLISLLRNLGPDILIATHSTEIITETETDEIVLISKDRRSARRLNNPSQIATVFNVLGSNTNPILTQLAKTKRVLFVEGKDFHVISKFARRRGESKVGNRQDFAVVPIDGFNPKRAQTLKEGMETALGAKIVCAILLDRDYRSEDECAYIVEKCREFCEYIRVHNRKEIENFLLIPDALDRAAKKRIREQFIRSGKEKKIEHDVRAILDNYIESKKAYIVSQFISFRNNFERKMGSKRADATIAEEMMCKIDKIWQGDKLNLVSGKDAFSTVKNFFQSKYGISLTPNAIIEATYSNEMPQEMGEIIDMLKTFACHELTEA